MRFLDKLEGVQLTLETPSCILAEIAESRGIMVDENKISSDEIYRSNVFSTIKNSKANHVSFPYSDDDLEKIALYLNPSQEIDWDERSLLSGLNWVTKISRNISLVATSEHQFPTPEKTNSVSHLYVYRYLVSMGIRLRHDTKKEEMSRVCKYLHISSDYMIGFIQSRIPLLSREELAFLSSTLDVNRKYPKVELLKVNNIIQEGPSKQHYQPRTPEEAIAIAAKNYSMDISSFEDPLFIYMKLGYGEFPLDDYSSKLSDVFKNSYEIGINFNPFFPSSVYTSESMKKLCMKDGLRKTNSIEMNYEQLQVSFFVKRFHLGIIPGSPLETMINLDSISDTDKSLFLTYGSSITSWSTYTVAELRGIFQEHKCFYDPIDGIFEKEAILSLVELSRKMSSKSMLKSSIKREWESLYRLVIELKEAVNDIKKYCRDLSEFYLKQTPEKKDRMKKILRDILHLGLYARGLRNLSECWPIWEVPPSDSDLSKKISGEKLYELMMYVNADDSKVLLLPLLKVEAKSHTIHINHDYTKGLTIGDRLKIMSEGNMGSGESCIRTTSSYLLASGYTYLSALGETFEQDFSKIKIVL